ncbi:Prefoldin subunit 2 [Hypsizygus marmoreus]|uniref:Prefoldin subunit 2 n=1 Tax=Hypsizygus marmoreus TaxID=39966 RepID=A0A369JHY7_HYPMA|nr:Prefoldin subunit 2 [Hypsizygus marmoreus]
MVVTREHKGHAASRGLQPITSAETQNIIALNFIRSPTTFTIVHMSSSIQAAKAKAKAPVLSDQEIQQNYIRMQNEMQALAGKIGELEQQADEHSLVLTTLNETLEEEPGRKCFRLIGGVLVERTVKDVVPTLQTTADGIRKAISNLTEQYKSKEQDLDSFKREYNIRPV